MVFRNSDPVGAEANPEFQKKAGNLQLEDYKKKITKEMLDKAKISDQEYKDFLKAYEEKLKREAAEKTTPDKLPDARRVGPHLIDQRGDKGLLPGTGSEQRRT